MKKILAALLAFAMLIGCVLTFASCGAKPRLDLEKAEEALEDEDYNVSYDDDVDSMGEKERLYAYNDEDYIEIRVFDSAKTAKLAYEALKLELDYEIEGIELQIKTYKHMLSKYEDDIDEDDFEEKLEELEESLKELKKEYCVGRSGKTVWRGTANAIKDSKK